ncbi:MAG: TIM-barrel domain-containing protein [bacterium]
MPSMQIIIRYAVVIFTTFILITSTGFTLEKSKTPPVSPAWVFDHWVWEDDVNTEQALWQLIDGYLAHGIPVGAVIIDSPWATEYNNFIFNKELYPDPEGMINRLHEKGIKAILWMTSMINIESKTGEGEPTTNETFQEGLQKGFFANDGETYKWWKGRGAFVDYTNPAAVQWWHGMMNRVLDLGFDGWKVDGTDAHFPAQGKGYGGTISTQQYREMYYMDTYEYTVSKNPSAITLPRSVDILFALPKGFSPVSHTPASWVGDERHNWEPEGFPEAIRDVLDAGKLGYAVVGSDIGGYHGDDPITKRLLLRWAQFGAFCPLMENGGHGAHQPWLHDEETVRIYRKFVKLHLELKPYLYSMMMKAHNKRIPIVRPYNKGQFQYMFGDALFVAPFYEDKDEREVLLPDGVWIDYWDNKKNYEGGTKFIYNASLDRYPVFIRKGAVIPLYIADEETGHGAAFLKDKVTIDIYPADGGNEFTLYEEGKDSIDIKVNQNEGKIDISIAPANRDSVIRILSPQSPKEILVNGKKLEAVQKYEDIKEPGTAYYDEKDSRLWIRLLPDNIIEVEIKF